MKLISISFLSLFLVACAAPVAVDAGLRDGAASGEGGDGTAAGAGGEGGGWVEDGVCEPGAQRACYGGPEGTLGVGACVAGVETCGDEGMGFGACEGAVRPREESCATTADDNCDGEANEGCVCVPGLTRACYSGPPGTDGVGICHGGLETCAGDGLAWGPCEWEVVPAPAEDLNTPEDDDCTGTTHDSTCELNGITTCASGVCIGELVCGSAGGPLICHLVWKCLGS